MARKSIFTKEQIVKKCIEHVRKKGFDTLTARNVGAALGTSARPIFTFYSGMDELKEDVIKEAVNIFMKYARGSFDYSPAFKEFGRRVVRFADSEPNLFRAIFFHGREIPGLIQEMNGRILQLVMEESNITEEQAMQVIKLERTIALGMAAITINGAYRYSDEELNTMLALAYRGAIATLNTDKSTLGTFPVKVSGK